MPLIPRVAITGASGFLGRAACADLPARGYAVRAVTRSALPIAAAEVHRVSDLTNPDEVRNAVRDCEIVIHLAGIAHRRGDGPDDGEITRANVHATRTVCHEAASLGVRTIVLMSSAAAAGVKASHAENDTTVVPRVDTVYGRTKLEAEHVARESVASSQARLVIFRPPMIYGPGMKGNPLRLFRLVDAGIPLPLAGVRNQRSMLFVGNLFAAIAATLTSGERSERALYPTDGTPISTPDFIRKVATALGKPARLFDVPMVGLRTMARLADFMATFVKGLPGSDELERLTESFVVDDGPLRRVFSYQPAYDVDAGLAITASWWRERGVAS